MYPLSYKALGDVAVATVSFTSMSGSTCHRRGKTAQYGGIHDPRGSIYTAIMELGPQNHNGDGLLGPNSIIVVYMEPLGTRAGFENTLHHISY